MSLGQSGPCTHRKSGMGPVPSEGSGENNPRNTVPVTRVWLGSQWVQRWRKDTKIHFKVGILFYMRHFDFWLLKMFFLYFPFTRWWLWWWYNVHRPILFVTLSEKVSLPLRSLWTGYWHRFPEEKLCERLEGWTTTFRHTHTHTHTHTNTHNPALSWEP